MSKKTLMIKQFELKLLEYFSVTMTYGLILNKKNNR